MFSERAAQVRAAYAAFIDTPVTNELAAHAEADPVREAIALFQRTASSVPAYMSFLKEHGVDPAGVGDLDAFQRLPLTTRKGYLERFPLADRCRGGDLAGCDMIAVSS